MKKKLKVLVVILTFSLIVAGCEKGEELFVDWPEECQKEIALPANFPETILYTNARVIEDPEKGNSSTVFFCSSDDQEKILGWYKEVLKDYKNIEVVESLVVSKLYTWNQGRNQETVVLGFSKVVDNFNIFVINFSGFN